MADPMRRHWCLTLWLDAAGEPMAEKNGCLQLESWLNELHELAASSGARYYAWSLEDAELKSDRDDDEPEGAAAGLHLHAYIESDRSTRWSTMVRRAQDRFVGAHVEARRGWRATAREYHSGIRRGIDKEELVTRGEWGTWLDIGDGADTPLDDIRAEAAKMMLQGASPREVAERFPSWFIGAGAGVCRLYDVLHSRSWQL